LQRIAKSLADASDFLLLVLMLAWNAAARNRRPVACSSRYATNRCGDSPLYASTFPDLGDAAIDDSLRRLFALRVGRSFLEPG
jgi:hypothetical protein